VDRHRTFYLTWKDPSLGPKPADWFSLVAKIARPRRIEVDVAWAVSDIMWSSPGHDSANQISLPDPNERDDLLFNEQRLPYIGLTKFSDIPNANWSQWIDARIEEIDRESNSHTEASNEIWVRTWGDTKLSQLPDGDPCNQWIGRQESRYIEPFKDEWKSRFEPILDFTTFIDREISRIPYLSICVNSSVYTSMELYPFFSDEDVNEPWLPDFVNRNVEIFRAWMDDLSQTLNLTGVEWETGYRTEYGSELDPFFEKLFGPPATRNA